MENKFYDAYTIYSVQYVACNSNYIVRRQRKTKCKHELKIVNAIEIEIYLYSYEEINGIGRQSMKRPRLHVSLYSTCKLFDKKKRVMKLNECSMLILIFVCLFVRALYALVFCDYFGIWVPKTKFKSIELNSFCMRNSSNWICTHVQKWSLILLQMKRTVKMVHMHKDCRLFPQIS